jgi:hypothetical protein
VWEEPAFLQHLPETIKQALLLTDAPRTFVLEIGSEELPPQDVVSAVSQVTFFLAFFPQPF